MVIRKEIKRLGLQIFLVAAVIVVSEYENTVFLLLGLTNSKLQQLLDTLIKLTLWTSGGWLIYGAIDIYLVKIQDKKQGYATPKLVKDIIKATIFFVIILNILSNVFKVPISGLIAGSSVVAAVVGFAITRMISDVFSGAALSIERAYSVGDWLEIEAPSRKKRYITGEVVEINWRATHLHTKADELVVIPNSEMARMRIINFSKPERHYRAEVQLHVGHTVPSDRIKRILLAAVRGTPEIMTKPAPKITLLRFDSEGVLWSARFWVSDFTHNRKVVKAAHESVLRHFQIAGIDFSYPTVEMRNFTSFSSGLEKTPVKEKLLKRIEFFEFFNDAQLAVIESKMIKRSFKAKDTIIKQGDEGSSLYILFEGLIHIFVKDQGEKEIFVAQVEPGQYFGEMSLLTGQPRSATARAVTEIECFEISKDILSNLFAQTPELMEKISKVMAKRSEMLARLSQVENETKPPEEKANLAKKILQQMKYFFYADEDSSISESIK
ncbi:mechanosensitive ion channel family protein [Candidatus Magnetominusculus xianensis]|uniref:Mechanosensitive ion channel protein MscS n=1 Tax=Candidatus Magnetominusculus xianensis TaxID=1748249 RepID=A0ABR5SBR8_9BACT|nr:mechanosensitive ion channel family protein [Candidatus Magnetominusculus xianensis]KWT78235.1 mechanosensitive ion channel protein MscS [Candidatus Magnetominusculus xianensis]MBF0402813.1 mechanosensitive ion channel family protein [Nitrospirota bacterium]